MNRTDGDPDAQVRALLDDAVSQIEPEPGLDRIRDRTVRRHRPARAWGLGAVAVAAAVAGVLVVTTGLGPDGADRANTARPGPATDDGAAAGSVSWARPVRVYVVEAAGSSDPRLSVVTRPGPDGARLARARYALAQAVTGASDAGRGSVWPSGTRVVGVFSVGTANKPFQGGTDVTVDLSGPDLAHRPDGLSARAAAVTVQQLVYTARANLRGSARPVGFAIDGRSTRTVLGVPVVGGVGLAGPDRVLSDVQVETPGAGQRVTSPFTVRGDAAAVEGNVRWELMRDGVRVRRGFTTAAQCCTLAPYRFSVSAPPGEYTLVVRTDDPSGGEGRPPGVVRRTLLVR